jgi:hypothetical protein
MSSKITERKVYLNGIHGVTGKYLVPPMEVQQAARLARKKDQDPSTVTWLKNVRHLLKPHLGLPFWVKDKADIGQTGWGIVFHSEESEAVKKSLQRLIDHRATQIADPEKLKILEYHTGDDWSDWLADHGVSAGNVQPNKVPFYLLLIGSPDLIPFSFGWLLDVEYAVGRLHFESPEEYSAYVDTVIDYETSAAVPNAREAVFFGTQHPDDVATELSATALIKPLLEGTESTEFKPIVSYSNFNARALVGPKATTQALADIIHSPGNTKPPALLFTASHGIGFDADDPEQLKCQGALLCQDWPGLNDIRPEHYFAAANVSDEARLRGMIAFHFACYGAGTPDFDRFVHEPGEDRPRLAATPFISALPKRFLSHPNGGALAVIGHIDRAWDYSIAGNTTTPQVIPFQNCIGWLLQGEPVGLAMKDFNERYAVLSASLSDLHDRLALKFPVSDDLLASTWIERNDAEGYVVLGDPAVRLRVADIAN